MSAAREAIAFDEWNGSGCPARKGLPAGKLLFAPRCGELSRAYSRYRPSGESEGDTSLSN
jgi:hypothetical protein